jgi:hypothetical protein
VVLSGHYAFIFLEVLTKPTQTSIRLSGVPAELRIEFVSNTSLECYRQITCSVTSDKSGRNVERSVRYSRTHTNSSLCRICGYHSGGYKEYYLLGYDAA